MSNQSIYDSLRAAGMTKEGACGLMGNMMAESGMKANIAQRGMTKLSDEQYTAAADNGLIDFAFDQVGYGLYQLTFHTRKKNYLLFCKSRGCSVGDEQAQVDFCIKELKEDYPVLWKLLTESHDVFQCAQRICVDFERPAVNNVGTRYQFAQEFFNEFANGTPTPAPTPSNRDWKIAIIQFIMSGDGYWDAEVDGLKSQTFFDKLREYIKDMEGC